MGLADVDKAVILRDNKQGGGSPDSPQMIAGNAEVPDPRGGFVGAAEGAFALYSLAGKGAGLPAWGTKQRDRKLRELLFDSDNMLSGVVYAEVTRVQNTSWTLVADTNDNQEGVREWHTRLNEANFNQGFRDFLGCFAVDYLSQDNGVFVEYLVKGGLNRTHLPLRDADTGELLEEIIGIATMDSMQCYRTFDPEYPVVYFNPWNRQYYVYHYSRILTSAQFRQNIEMAMGTGLCAISRAYSAAALVKESHIYMYEKISGAEPEIIFVSGVGHKTLQNALTAAQTEAISRGATRYKGVIFIAPPSVGPNFPEVKTHIVGLKSVPDGWNHEQEVQLAVYKIALAFGLPAREIWPATQSGATKADAEAQDREGSPKGRTEVMRAIEYLFNHFVLPKGITFRFEDTQTKEQLEIERLRKARSDRMANLVQAGIILPEEARVMLAAMGDIDRNLAPGVMDNEMTEMEDGFEISLPAIPLPRLPSPKVEEKPPDDEQPPPTAKKELGRTRDFFSRTLANIISAASSIGFFRVVSEMDGLLRLAGEMAFIDGLNDGGYKALFGQIPLQFLTAFNQALTDQQEHVINFAAAVINAQDDLARAKIDSRAELWLNKGLMEFYWLGVLLAGAAQDKRYRWVLGLTEHCNTCLGASGQVHTAEEWLESGVYPRSSRLECGGYECQCSLEETDEPASGVIDTSTLQSGQQYSSPQGFWGRFLGRFTQ